MRFYILSDFHIGHRTDVETACGRLLRLCSKIRSVTEPRGEVLFIILGDFIYAGGVSLFKVAAECLDFIIAQLSEYAVHFIFLPGNHDYTGRDMAPFEAFAAQYSAGHPSEQRPVCSNVYGEVNFILVDSNLERVHDKPGRVDMEEIRRNIKQGMQNILFSHHGFTHSHGGDHDTISDGTAVLRELKAMGIGFAFHGHTHRAEVTIMPGYAVEIGCGTLAGDLSGMDGIFHQFSVGYIRDGNIVAVERWVDIRDGSDRLICDQLYPEERRFRDAEEVGKVQYANVPDHTIARWVIPHSTKMDDIYSRLLGNSKKLSLLDALLRNKRILLLADAGQGKSLEVQNLAYELSQTEYFPFLLALRNYTGEKISALLPEGYGELYPSRRILLFDGYDELSADERIIFERQLRIYIEDAPDSYILISARSNFCKAEKGDQSSTFPDFEIFDLCELRWEDIQSYVSACGLDVDDFVTAARVSDAESLLNTPFYLVKMAVLFAQENKLPPKGELMDRLIQACFQKDDTKFPEALEDNYRSMFLLLEKIAFAMQLMQRYCFDDRDEYQRLFKDTERGLVKHSGLLQRVGASWQFTHNNFREYLTARYLSRMSQAVATSFFSSGEDIKPSWVNTLGYLCVLEPAWDLKGWLTEHAPNALVKFEPDRIDAAARWGVFQRVFCNYEKQMLWLNDDLFDTQQLAHFACGSEALTFLLERIHEPMNYVSQYNAIDILRRFPRLFGRNDEVRQCLFACCEGFPATKNTICRLAMFALAQQKLYTPELTGELMRIFGNSDNDYIRLGMYEYLTAAGEHNEHVSYFLDGIQYIKITLGAKERRVGNESFELLSALKKMSTVESITEVLLWFAHAESTDFFQQEEVFSAICNTATVLYLQGECVLYNAVFQCYLQMVRHGHHSMARGAVSFFVDTGTLATASVNAALYFEQKMYYLRDLFIMQPVAFDHIKHAYLAGELPDNTVFHRLVQWQVTDGDQYAELAALIRETDQIDLPPRTPQPDYEAERRRAEQGFFDMLFDRRMAEQMLEEILSKSANPDPTVKDMVDERIDFDFHSPLLTLFYAMYHFAPDTKATSFFSAINWEHFVLPEVQKMLEQEDVIPSLEQKDYLAQTIKDELERGALDNAVSYYTDGIKFSALAAAIVYLTTYLDLPIDESFLLQMTELPAFCFDSENDRKKYEFLTKHIPRQTLCRRVIDNVHMGRVQGEVLRDHIEFCLAIRCDGIVSEAKAICITEKPHSFLRSSALKYLYELLGADYVSSEILPYVDGELLIEIKMLCPDIPREQLRLEMEERFSQEPTDALLAHLITLGSRRGVEYYITKVKRDNRISDEIPHEGPTDTIGTIHDPQMLPLLAELLEIVFRPDFVDESWVSLQDKVMRALINCSQTAPDEAIAIVEAQKKALAAENDIRSCNYVLNEIARIKQKNSDLPKSIDEVERLLAG